MAVSAAASLATKPKEVQEKAIAAPIISRGEQTISPIQDLLRRAKVRKAACVRVQDLSVLDYTAVQSMQTLRKMQNDARRNSRQHSQLQFQSLLLKQATVVKGQQDFFVL